MRNTRGIKTPKGLHNNYSAPTGRFFYIRIGYTQGQAPVLCYFALSGRAPSALHPPSYTEVDILDTGGGNRTSLRQAQCKLGSA